MKPTRTRCPVCHGEYAVSSSGKICRHKVSTVTSLRTEHVDKGAWCEGSLADAKALISEARKQKLQSLHNAILCRQRTIESETREIHILSKKIAKIESEEKASAVGGETEDAPRTHEYVYGVIESLSANKLVFVVKLDVRDLRLNFSVTTYHGFSAPVAGVRVRVMRTPEGRYIWVEPAPAEATATGDH